MVDRRAAGAPLEHVLGWSEFCGRRFVVTPGVFVPRRRTEFLVDRAAAVTEPGAVVVDLCCGCGAVGGALADIVGEVELYAVDIDPAAVRCARRNLVSVGAHVYEGDLYQPLPPALRGRVDVFVANTPYVPTSEVDLLPPEARLHEPRIALDGGTDGLDLQRRIAAEAPAWLAPGGRVLVEVSEHQAQAAVSIFRRCRLSPRVSRSAELEATVVVAAYGCSPSQDQRGIGTADGTLTPTGE
jgi:release factor glutamine methyltransferase